jgi:argininosuccinate lyase
MNNLENFIGSFSFDFRLAPFDIEGSIAHVKMLIKCKIIGAKEGAQIIKGLQSILKDLNNGHKLPPAEDIHYAVEKELIKRIGAIGGKMHTARSRNDQVALDLRLYVRDEIKTIIMQIKLLQKVLLDKAEKNIDVIMPGFTHLQPAQGILAAHHLLSYAMGLKRDAERFSDCLKRVNVLPLGSAALAGTSFKIDRHLTARLLGFDSVSQNSIDAVSDRDFAAEFVFCISLLSMRLTRFCEEIILWLNPEFSYIKIGDEFTSGSSIMPQKRNPDCAEIIRGKSGRLLGDLTALLTLIKSLPTAYNRDLQEDKPPLFDAADNIKVCLDIMIAMTGSLEFIKENTLKSARKGFMEATEIADYLARKGIPFRTAHSIVKKIVSFCIEKGKTLNEMDLSEFKLFSPLIEKDIYKYIDIKTIIDLKTSEGGTSKKSVLNQIKLLSKTCL